MFYISPLEDVVDHMYIRCAITGIESIRTR